MSELVALSDLHLGDRDKENGSVLTSLDVRKTFAERLGYLTGGQISTLVITGDLFEVCVPTRTVKQDLLHETTCFGLYNSTVEDARSFFAELAKTIKITWLVWVPGNHDFTLHRSLCGDNSEYTQPSGRGLRWSGQWGTYSALEQLFGSAIPNIVTAYPNFVYESSEGWPLALFTHGHLYDNQVLKPDVDFLRTLGLALETGHVWEPIPENIETGGSWCKRLVALTNHRVADIWPQNLSLVAEAVYDYVLRRQTRVFCPDRPPAPGDRVVPPKFSALDVTSTVRGHLGWYCDNALVDIAPVLPLRYRGATANLPRSFFVCGHTHAAGGWLYDSFDGMGFDVFDLGGWTMDAVKNRDNVPHTHALIWDRFPSEPICHALNVGRP